MLRTKQTLSNNNFRQSSGDILRLSGTTLVYGTMIAMGSGGLSVSNGNKGDITTTNSGNTWTINSSAVTTTKILNQAVTFVKLQNSAGAGLSVIGRNTNSAGSFSEITAGSDGHVLRRNSTALGFGTLASGAFADNTITPSRITNQTLGVLGRSTNSSGSVANISATAGSGRVLRESGNTIGFGTITSNGFADNTITPARLTNSTLSVVGRTANTAGSNSHIAAVAGSGGVLRESGSTIGFGTISTSSFANDSVTYAKIQNVTSQRILGRFAGTSGDVQEITIGTGLNLNSSTGLLTTTGSSQSGSGSTYVLTQEITGTSYTFQDSDHGKHFRFLTGSTATIPSGLTTGWNVLISRSENAGIVNIVSQGTLESTGTALVSSKTAASIYHAGNDLHVAFGAFTSYPAQNKTVVIEGATSGENLTIFYTTEAITISQVTHVIRGSGSPSLTWNISYASDRSTGSPTNLWGSSRTTTDTTTGHIVTSITNASIPANRWIWLTSSAISGVVNEIAITLTYYNT